VLLSAAGPQVGRQSLMEGRHAGCGLVIGVTQGFSFA